MRERNAVDDSYARLPHQPLFLIRATQRTLTALINHADMSLTRLNFKRIFNQKIFLNVNMTQENEIT